MSFFTPENSVIELAKTVDPSNWLLGLGYSVGHSRGGDEIALWLDERTPKPDIRITRQAHRSHAGWDIWLCCWADCSPIGRGSNNIDLALELRPGQGGDLIRLASDICEAAGVSCSHPKNGLSPARSVFSPIAVLPKAAERPVIPPEANREGGREYLITGRGISPEVVTEAERQGAIHYLSDGVLFLGRDEQGEIRSATKRATSPDADPPKRDLARSQKSYPPILDPGPNGASVWIVEGFVDGLAVWDIAWRRKLAGTLPAAPYVIVTGGCRTATWITNSMVQEILRSVDAVRPGHIYISLENDDPEKETKKYITKQAERIHIEAGVDVKIIPVPLGYKDMADYNMALKKQV